MNPIGSGPDERIAVLHLISGLTMGGAESMLLWSARAHDRARLRMGVVSLMAGGVLASAIEGEGVPVFELGARRGRVTPTILRSLVSTARGFSPDILQSHLFHSNILSRLLRPFLPGVRVVNTMHTGWEPWPRRLAYRVSSRLADAVVSFPSGDGAGAAPARTRPRHFTLPYGIPYPRPPLPARAATRARLGIGESVPVWGAAGRLSMEKGFDVLVDALNLVGVEGDGPILLLLGEGDQRRNLERRARDLGLDGRIHLLGGAVGLADLFSAADFFVLPSRWESGPLVLLEAMAAGLPVVATDVGQVRRMVTIAGCGVVVPPARPAELARAMGETMAAGRQVREEAMAGVDRIREAYDFGRVQDALEDCYRAIAGGMR